MRRLRLVAALLVAGGAVGVVGTPAVPTEPAPTGVRVLMVGDSVLEGIGATPRRPVMARVAARRLGWQVVADGVGGTGYVNSGRRPGQTYGDRLERHSLPQYDVVVVEGGHNDWRADPVLVAQRVRAVVGLVRARAPETQVVLVGAYDPPGVRLRGPVDDVVASVAAELDAPFVSPIRERWAEGQPARFLSGDRLHPSAFGYGVMGERLAAALRRLVTTS